MLIPQSIALGLRLRSYLHRVCATKHICIMKSKVILSWGYWFSALSLGLLLHPYATLRKMVRDKLLRPLVLLPVVSTALLWMGTVVVVHGGAEIAGGLGWVTPIVLTVSLRVLVDRSRIAVPDCALGRYMSVRQISCICAFLCSRMIYFPVATIFSYGTGYFGG